jgi:hypothetical protein
MMGSPHGARIATLLCRAVSWQPFYFPPCYLRAGHQIDGSPRPAYPPQTDARTPSHEGLREASEGCSMHPTRRVRGTPVSYAFPTKVAPRLPGLLIALQACGMASRQFASVCTVRAGRGAGFVGDFSGRFALHAACAAACARSAVSCRVWVVVGPRGRVSNTRADTETMPLGYCSSTARVLLVGLNPSGERALRRQNGPKYVTKVSLCGARVAGIR